jgi:iron(III) transport system permease protein
VLGVLGPGSLDAAALAVLRHQWHTVLPDYALQSALLARRRGPRRDAAGLGHSGCGDAVRLSGRRHFEWALLLPLAMPAYVLAYAWTDALQYSGPLQSSLRELLACAVRCGPTCAAWGCGAAVRAVPVPLRLPAGARRAGRKRGAADGSRAAAGRGPRRRVLEVALPLARPAIAAGTALALMETLADYGVGSYFGLTTFSTGIYKAWLVMNDRTAAAQLAAVLLVVVALLLGRAQRAAPHALHRQPQRRRSSAEARPLLLRGARRRRPGAAVRAAGAAGLRAAGGLAGAHAVAGGGELEVGLPLARFAGWAWSASACGHGARCCHAAGAGAGLCAAPGWRRRSACCARRRACCRWVTRCRAR